MLKPSSFTAGCIAACITLLLPLNTQAQVPESFFSCLNGGNAIRFSKLNDTYRLTISHNATVDFDETCPEKYVSFTRDTQERQLAFRYKAVCDKPADKESPKVRFEIYDYSRFSGPDAPHYEKGAVTWQGIFVRQLFCTSNEQSLLQDLVQKSRYGRSLVTSPE